MSKVEKKPWMFDVITHPVVTEKSMLASEKGQVTFKVPLTASKKDIKLAVEAIFGVKVEGVNTLRQNGKMKRFRGHLGSRQDYKKAIVKLAEGQNIDMTTGI